MIFNNDITTTILQESNQNCTILYKIALLNREHMIFVKNYFTNFFMKQILPSIDCLKYINRYYTCDKCQYINPYINESPHICDECMKNVDSCEYCGTFRDKKDLIDHPHRGIYCRDKCIYHCMICNVDFNDKKDVAKIYDFTFICYPCYVQESTLKHYQKRIMKLSK
jgi:hypothetical protein